MLFNNYTSLQKFKFYWRWPILREEYEFISPFYLFPAEAPQVVQIVRRALQMQ